MKSWLISLLIVLILAGVYYTEIFALLAGQGALITALVFVVIVLLAALKVLGNPFRRADDDDENKQ